MEISYNISVRELRAYWEKVHNLADGERIGVYPRECMPSWMALCDELPWETYTLDGGYFSAKHHGFQGVYRLFALENAGDLKSAPTFRRLGGDDPTGTLYIGEAGDLAKRLNQARRSARSYRREDSHGAISAMRQIPKLNFPIEKIGVALMYTDRLTRMIERDLLYSYINTFGDSPPLNYKI